MFPSFATLLVSGEGQSQTGTGGNLLTNLYAYYKLDEASGNALDASGNGHNLPNFANAIGSTGGIINTSRLWPGTQAYFTGGASTNFQPGTQHFSYSLWVNLTTISYAGGSGDVGLLVKTATGVDREFILWWHTSGGDFKFYFFCSTDGINATTLIWPTPPIAGTWYHLAGGWDGVNMWLTINAAPRLTAAFAGPIFIGNSNFAMGFEQGSSAFLTGSIDEVAFWIGRDLTDAEVANLYNSGVGLPFSSF